MAFTRFKQINLDDPKWRGEDAGIVTSLMLACNDMSLCNQALSMASKEDAYSSAKTASGARMYFLRMQISHLWEALKIVPELRASANLMRRVKSSDQRTQESFRQLLW